MRFDLRYFDGEGLDEFIIAYDHKFEVYSYLSNQDEDDLWLIVVMDDENEDYAYIAADEWMAEAERM